MTCSVCLSTTPELQEVIHGVCPRCGTNYAAFIHAPLTTKQVQYNTRTRKLIATGDAYRDRLVAARLSLRSNA